MLKKMFAVFSLFVIMIPMIAFAEEVSSSSIGVVAGESSSLLADALVEGTSVQVATLSQDEMQAVEAGRSPRWWKKYRRQILSAIVVVSGCVALGLTPGVNVTFGIATCSGAL